MSKEKKCDHGSNNGGLKFSPVYHILKNPSIGGDDFKCP
jgi:hypothetical protein